jgi:hypothetical protein
MRKLFLTFFALALSALAADVSGKWTGTVVVDTDNARSVFLILKQNGSQITGSAGYTADEQVPIENGKVDGDTITFEVTTEDSMYKIKLVSDGEGMKGTVDFKHGDDSHTLKLALTRVKA